MDSNSNDLSRSKEFNMVKLSMTFDKEIHSDFIVNSLDKAIYLINDYLADSPNEVMMGIAMDSDRKPICCSVLGSGNEHSIGDIKTNIFRFALLSCADSIVLIHNHPRSSRLELSNADLNELNNIQHVASMLGIRLRDFIVVGNQKQNRAYYSWNEKRVITQYDFIDAMKYVDVQKTIEVDSGCKLQPKSDPDSLLNSTENLLKESRFNSPDSVAEKINDETVHANRKGFFRMFNDR